MCDSSETTVLVIAPGPGGVLAILGEAEALKAANGHRGRITAATTVARARELRREASAGDDASPLLAVFPRRGLRFEPAPATGTGSVRTANDVRYKDTLLLFSDDEYTALLAAGASTRAKALRALGRTESAQREWEARAYEAARIALDQPVDPRDLAGGRPSDLHRLLLQFRSESRTDWGILVHCTAPPEADEILLTGKFSRWVPHPGAGAIPLKRLTAQLWAAVVPEGTMPPGEKPHRIRFLIRAGASEQWASGPYPTWPSDERQSAAIAITGCEVYFSRERAAERLLAIEGAWEVAPEGTSATADASKMPDYGRLRWLDVTREQAAQDMGRLRWIAPKPLVDESLERIADAAENSGCNAVAEIAREFLEVRSVVGSSSRLVYASELPHLLGYPVPASGGMCVTEDILHEPRELDLTVCRQLYALLDPDRGGEENEREAERLLSPAIVHVAMEMIPYARRGGVADVVHGLPSALEILGQSVAVIIPYYANMSDDLLGIEPTGTEVEALGERLEVMQSSHHGVDVYLLKHPRFGERPYDGDELAVSVLFCRAALAAMKALRMKPDIIHCHDWQTGLLPAYVREARDADLEEARVLFTVHNLGYRGSYPDDRFWVTGLSPEMHGLYRDVDHGFSLLTGGIRCAGPGRVNTVSPNYAREITETELGWGMQEILREVGTFGILNGIDYQVYDPETDPHIHTNYDVESVVEARPKNKAALQRVRVAILGEDTVASHMPEILPGCTLTQDPDTFLIGMIARVAEQKGLEVMVEALRIVMDQAHEAQFIFNGQPAAQGDFYCRDIIRMLFPLVNLYPNRILIRFSHEFDHALGQRMYAGCDIIVSTPSYEPCGLEPMKCTRYGCVPLVRATGGLADQVSEFHPTDNPEGNGFVFHDFEPEDLADALRRAMALYHGDRPEWNRLVQRGMRRDFSWEESARTYLNWYYRVSRE